MNPGVLLSILAAAVLATGVTAQAGNAATILVEAESFAAPGGWVIDQQAMDQMGSAYALAHGLGVPVKDASTTLRLPAAGDYHVWVRTRDWVAPWNAPGSPGRFQVLVDGKPLSPLFGTRGARWHWERGGKVHADKPEIRLALHDLTGFDGRCDAILLTTDASLVPPDEGPELARLRRVWAGLPAQPDDAGQYDLVVVGGGIAGTCAAITAARLGATVALVHDRPMLGGNNSSEVRVGLSGKIDQQPYPKLGSVVREISPIGYYDFLEARRHPERPESKTILALDPIRAEHNAGPATNYEDNKKLAVVRAEKNLRLFLNAHVDRVEKQGDRIAAVVARDIRTGRATRFRGRLFVDCTGDACVGFLAGADWRMGREAQTETGEARAPAQADRLVMGTSVQWYATMEEQPVAFAECPWAMEFNEQTCQRVTKGDWDWETGMNRDQVADVEAIRDHALRVTYGNWAFLKNHAADKAKYANQRLDWVAYIGGKRESRRLLGDVILCQQDVEQARPYPDASVTTTWTIDLHFPAPANTRFFPGQEFRSVAIHTKVKPYPIPYRCLYSRNIANLFMAGRNISVTHVALGTIRVQKTTGMMGEVVGMATALAKKHDTMPRGVYQQHLDELKALMLAGPPAKSR
jgi:hypothetical protein